MQFHAVQSLKQAVLAPALLKMFFFVQNVDFSYKGIHVRTEIESEICMSVKPTE